MASTSGGVLLQCGVLIQKIVVKITDKSFHGLIKISLKLLVTNKPSAGDSEKRMFNVLLSPYNEDNLKS